MFNTLILLIITSLLLSVCLPTQDVSNIVSNTNDGNTGEYDNRRNLQEKDIGRLLNKPII